MSIVLKLMINKIGSYIIPEETKGHLHKTFFSISDPSSLKSDSQTLTYIQILLSDSIYGFSPCQFTNFSTLMIVIIVQEQLR